MIGIERDAEAHVESQSLDSNVRGTILSIDNQ